MPAFSSDREGPQPIICNYIKRIRSFLADICTGSNHCEMTIHKKKNNQKHIYTLRKDINLFCILPFMNLQQRKHTKVWFAWAHHNANMRTK